MLDIDGSYGTGGGQLVRNARALAALGGELAADPDAGASLDAHAADQMPVCLALAGGESTFTTREPTDHVRTAMRLIGQFLPVRFAAAREGPLTRIGVSRR